MLANVRRHAEASNAWVSMASDAKQVELVVRDDGPSTDTESPDSNGTGTTAFT